MSTLLSTVPTTILAGNPEATWQHAEQMICKALCPQQAADCFCSSCRAVKQQQHAFLRVLNPEKDYSVDDIDEILHQSRLTRDPNESFFFVLCKAETLSVAAANRLLKLLEEPPYGYFFILLTNNLDALLPTIVSRGRVQLLHAAANTSAHPLLNYFYHNSRLSNPLLFEQAISQSELTDSKSIELLNALFEHYQQHYHSLLRGDNDPQALDYASRVICYLQKIMEQPPQSGSSAIFWKMLFATFPQDTQ